MESLTNQQVIARYRTAISIIDVVAEESPVFNNIYQEATNLRMSIESELEERGINPEEIDLHDISFVTA